MIEIFFICLLASAFSFIGGFMLGMTVPRRINEEEKKGGNTDGPY